MVRYQIFYITLHYITSYQNDVVSMYVYFIIAKSAK